MFLTRTFQLIYDATLAVVYPQSCAVCGGSVESCTLGVACADCWAKTRLFSTADTLCRKCGHPSPGPTRVEDVSCRRCNEESFNYARSCGVYEVALRATVLALKREPHLAPLLISLLAGTLLNSPLTCATMIVPVPLHPERERKRGFNQSVVIARAVSRASGLPVAENVLVRTVHTNRHRGGMDEKARRQTVANAFRVQHPGVISAEHVLLVDDVFTTGATAGTCSTALLSAGAKEVSVLTIARTLFV